MERKMSQNTLTEEQIQEIKQSFQAIDINNDGRLSVYELMKAQQALGLNPTEADTRKMIDEVDANKSGFIELNEYVTLMADRYGALDYEKEMMKAAFQHFDKDCSGYLSKEQLYSYLTRCGEKLDPEEFDMVIADIDTDGDGRIDIEEFTTMLTKNDKEDKLS